MSAFDNFRREIIAEIYNLDSQVQTEAPDLNTEQYFEKEAEFDSTEDEQTDDDFYTDDDSINTEEESFSSSELPKPKPASQPPKPKTDIAKEAKDNVDFLEKMINKKDPVLVNTLDGSKVPVPLAKMAYLKSKRNRIRELDGNSDEYQFQAKVFLFPDGVPVPINGENVHYLWDAEITREGDVYKIKSAEEIENTYWQDLKGICPPEIDATPIADESGVDRWSPQEKSQKANNYRYSNEETRKFNEDCQNGRGCKPTPMTENGCKVGVNYANSENFTSDYDRLYKYEQGKVKVGGKVQNIDKVTKNYTSIDEFNFYGDNKWHNFIGFCYAWADDFREEADRITSLAVIQDRVIANGVAFNLTAPKEALEKIPISKAKAIGRGETAPLFLPYPELLVGDRNLIDIEFDNTTQAFTFIRNLMHNDKAGVSSLFKYYDTLQTVTIEGQVTTREDICTRKGHNTKMKMAREKRGWQMFSAFNGKNTDRKSKHKTVTNRNTTFFGWEVYEGGIRGMGNDLQSHFFNRIKENAKNMDKHFIKGVFGIGLNAALLIPTLKWNCIAHMVGWGKDKIVNAVSGYADDEEFA